MADSKVDLIDRALVKAMPMLATQPRDKVWWTWLRGAYEAGCAAPSMADSKVVPRGEPVAWLCAEDAERLRLFGTGVVYAEKQKFILLPEQEQTPLYAAPSMADDDVRAALRALLGEVNNIEVLGEWSALDMNISSGKKVRAKVDEVIANARRALSATPSTGDAERIAAPPADEDVRLLVERLRDEFDFDATATALSGPEQMRALNLLGDARDMLTRLSASEAALRQRLADETRDTERYRWWRDTNAAENSADSATRASPRFDPLWRILDMATGEEIDATIDDAIRASKGRDSA